LDLSASAPRNGRAVMARSTAECIVNVTEQKEWLVGLQKRKTKPLRCERSDRAGDHI
jgi:hypothetical protein